MRQSAVPPIDGELDWSAYAGLDPTQPGPIIAIVRDGLVQHWRTFGAVEPQGRALDRASTFYVASVAKQFTAACIGLLILDGDLHLDDDVRRFIPELPDYSTTVQIGHLLAHTSGLPDGHALDRTAGWDVSNPCSMAQRVELVVAAELEATPGTVHRYSNYGYVLLAEVVSRISGACLGVVAADRLFAPAKMKASGFLDTEHPLPVPGWTADSDRIEVSISCVGDGGLLTSVEDLARWDAWLPTSPLAALMLGGRPVLPDGRWAHDAWGISVRTHRGLRIESHGGSITGYMASYVRFSDIGVSFLALANTDADGVDVFGRRLRSFVDAALRTQLQEDEPPWNETHGIPVDQPADRNGATLAAALCQDG